MDADLLYDYRFPDIEQDFDERFSILYALSIGLGGDPMDDDQLRYVYEKDLRAFPTMALVVGTQSFWPMNPEFKIDWMQLLHGEQELVVHQPLPASGSVVGRQRITGIEDKGTDKGALIRTERTLTDTASGALLATMRQTLFARADGGFGGENPPRPKLWSAPERVPDAVCELPTSPNNALLYRLTGDDNPLHAVPRVAAAAGFERPVLHGLCTFGVIAHALVRTLGRYDATRLTELSCRFSAPVMPGDVIRTAMWADGADVIFQATDGRGRVVATRGTATVAPS